MLVHYQENNLREQSKVVIPIGHQTILIILYFNTLSCKQLRTQSKRGCYSVKPSNSVDYFKTNEWQARREK